METLYAEQGTHLYEALPNPPILSPQQAKITAFAMENLGPLVESSLNRFFGFKPHHFYCSSSLLDLRIQPRLKEEPRILDCELLRVHYTYLKKCQ